jgi:uncharacterized OB-fold protein
LPFKAGFIAGDLADLDALRLLGSRCRTCGVVLLGKRHRCENCSSPQLDDETFTAHGTVHTYTIQRFPPPQPNSCVLPWVPRPVAWIDLADGPRIIGVIRCSPDVVSIGLTVRLHFEIGWITADGSEVVTYGFVPDSSHTI